MIHWAYLVVSVFVGFGLGVFAIALISAGRDEHHYRLGFQEGMAEGHAAGFKDGLAESQRVG